jgi:hypothetical protein
MTKLATCCFLALAAIDVAVGWFVPEPTIETAGGPR